MAVEDIIATAATHCVEGVMFHAEMSQWYDFLGCLQYSNEHWGHSLSELKAYKKLQHAYLCETGKLIKVNPFGAESPIPVDWQDKKSADVSKSNLDNLVMHGFDAWRQWETQTAKLYSDSYFQLLGEDERKLAELLFWMANDADMERKKAAHVLDEAGYLK